MKQFVIVVAGGKGTRMGATVPKQFLELEGKAIILHTLEKLSKALPEAMLFLVLPVAERERWNAIAKGTPFENIVVAPGGTNRFESVQSGLQQITEQGVVGVHDVVRPFASEETIRNVFKEAEASGAAIPVVELKESIRKVTNEGTSLALDRSAYRLVQTPQCFNTELLKEAYAQGFQPHFTDDASVVEANHIAVSLVEGNYENIKITTAEDLIVAKGFLNRTMS